MLETGQNWDLFGYDVRQVVKHWQSAWREFLWGYDSPVKARLDEVVRVHSESGVHCYHGGVRTEQSATDCEAVLLPGALVLTKNLFMPLAVESDLDLAMALEVRANSPFPEDDTGSGWKVVARDDSKLQVQMAIVSLSATMSYLGRQYDCHDVHAREVWAQIDHSMIVLSGFGEKHRLQRYNKRLIRVAGMLAFCAVIAVIMFGLAAGVKHLELNQYREMSADIQRQAAEASRMRSSLAIANETITTVNAFVSAQPNPHYELARLTRLMGDGAALRHFSMRGKNIKLRGRALDAAAVMQQLTDEPAYGEVTGPIRKVGNTELEQFDFNIALVDESPL